MRAGEPRLPLVASFPRCGAHWVLCSIECFLGRPRAFFTGQAIVPCQVTLLSPDERTRPAVFLHAHDVDLAMDYDPSRTLYLYREPAPVLFSLVRTAARRNAEALRKLSVPRYVSFQAAQYRRHLEKYLLSDRKALLALRYEKLVATPAEEFPRICQFLQIPADMARLSAAWQSVTRTRLAAQAPETHNAFFNAEMASSQYAEERAAFMSQYGRDIESLVLTEQLASFFRPL